MKRFLTTILAVLLLSTCAWSADTVQVMQGGKILPQYLGINATYPANWNATTGVLSDVSAGGKLRRTTVFTTNATYKKPTWLKFVKGFIMAPGGSGAGAVATNATQCAVGSGGCSGSISFFEFNATQLAAEETITIPQGVSGTSGAAGTTGGTASFGSLVTAPGGVGGLISTAQKWPNAGGASGGAAGVGGYLNIAGNPSGFTRAVFDAEGVLSLSNGANSYLGGGGIPGYAANGGGAAAKGAGGGGCGQGQNGAARTGGASGGGIMVLEEYE